jgi:pimeloyl-ACP methyl ester carboxylesterase
MKQVSHLLTLALLSLLVFTSACKKDDTTTTVTPSGKTFVLVHGAWADSSAWGLVEPYLKAQGHAVINVNLPAHGADNTPYSQIQLATYVNAVVQAIGIRQVTLVGHSLSGLVVGEVTQRIPTQIRKLVYLAAYVPRNAETVLQLSGEDTETLLPPNLVVNTTNNTATVVTAQIPAIFAADATPAIQANLVATHKPESLVPFGTPATVTAANFGAVSKAYVYTVNDKAIGYQLQQRMTSRAGITKTYALATSHTPFLSMPKAVGDILLQEVL